MHGRMFFLSLLRQSNRRTACCSARVALSMSGLCLIGGLVTKVQVSLGHIMESEASASCSQDTCEREVAHARGQRSLIAIVNPLLNQTSKNSWLRPTHAFLHPKTFAPLITPSQSSLASPPPSSQTPSSTARSRTLSQALHVCRGAREAAANARTCGIVAR